MATKKKTEKKKYIIVNWDFGTVQGDKIFESLEEVNPYLNDILREDYDGDVNHMQEDVFVYEVNPLIMNYIPASVETINSY